MNNIKNASNASFADEGLQELVSKPNITRFHKFLRLLRSASDPRAYLHMVKILNYYNYTHVAPLRKVTLGVGASISPTAAFSNPERIEAGNWLRLGDRCHLWAGPSKGRIVIGDNALFGPDVLVTAATYRYWDGSPVTKQKMNESHVSIGDDVWIGAKSVILPGTQIGDGAIIGACSVVTGDIPSQSVVAGIPAKFLRERG